MFAAVIQRYLFIGIFESQPHIRFIGLASSHLICPVPEDSLSEHTAEQLKALAAII